MTKTVHSLILAALMLVGCSESKPDNMAINIVEDMEPAITEDAAPVNEFGFYEAMEQSPTIDPFGEAGPSAKDVAQSTSAALERDESVAETSVSRPNTTNNAQIAYSYAFGFSIDQESIPKLQRAHTKLCSDLGSRCRILRMSQAGTDGFDGYGELRLQVEASQAQAFGDALSHPAKELGGEQVSFVVDGDDLTETIIDTEAKLESRIILRDKLTTILRNNRGAVDELVKAERAVAEVNEEIDANRSKLEKLRNRIRYSSVAIEYNPYLGESGTGFFRPVWIAITSIGSTLGMTISILIYILTALVPITLVVLGLRWVLHKFGFRFRFWKKDLKADAS